MPWLVHRPLDGSVQANFDDFVFGAEHGPVHCRDTGVRAEVGEAFEQRARSMIRRHRRKISPQTVFGRLQELHR
jgi:hypothetical protein